MSDQTSAVVFTAGQAFVSLAALFLIGTIVWINWQEWRRARKPKEPSTWRPRLGFRLLLWRRRVRLLFDNPDRRAR